MKKRILSLALALLLVVAMLPTSVLAAGFPDADGHWAAGAIDRWAGYGVVNGDNRGFFNPGKDITRGEMAAIIDRLLGLPAAPSAGFGDVKPGDWFAGPIDRCAAAGIITGSNGMARPNDPITRQEAIVMIARALNIDPIANPNLANWLDGGLVPSWANGFVAAMIKAGIVGGVGDRLIGGDDNIDRASVVTIFDRAIVQYINAPGAYNLAASTGIVVVTADNVTLTGSAAQVIVTGSNVAVNTNGTRLTVKSGATGVTENGKSVAVGTTTTAAPAPVQPSVPSQPTTPSRPNIPLHTHRYVAVVTAPTCTAQGYTTYTCNGCGHSYVSDYVVAAGHGYSFVVTTPATCTTEGLKTFTCGKCGDSYTAVIPATGHNQSGWVVTKVASCIEAGEEVQTCSNCGVKVTRVVPVTGHKFVAGSPFAASCTQPGYTPYTCSVCNTVEKRDEVPVLEHVWNDGEEKTNDECGTYILYTCTLGCGETRTESAGEIKHTWPDSWTPGTGADTGYHTKTCSNCGLKQREQCTFDAWRELYGDAASEGHCRECTACRMIHEEAHTYVKAMTSETQATYTCSACNYSYTETYVAKVGTTYYTDLTDALNAVDSGTLVLLADAGSINFNEGPAVTINPNGKTVSLAYTSVDQIKILDTNTTGVTATVNGSNVYFGKPDANNLLTVAVVYAADYSAIDVYTADGLLWLNTISLAIGYNDTCTIKLMADIDLAGETWTPLNMYNPESGHYVINGNEKTISNMTNDPAVIKNVGFIGSFAGKSLRISNLTFASASMTNTGSFAGIVIGYQYGDVTLNNVDVTNSTISGRAGTADIRIGGLVGFSVLGDGAKLTLTGCDVSNTNITGWHNVGGLVGTLQGFTANTSAWSFTSNTVSNCVITLITGTAKDTYASAFATDGGFSKSAADYIAYFTTNNTATNVRIQLHDGFVQDLNANTYEVSTAAGLQYLAKLVNSDGKPFSGETVKLTANIDLTGIDWEPIGNVLSYPSKTFAGIFEGNGKTISNMTASASGDGGVASAGLFGSITGVVQNVTIDNATITSTHYAGGIVGYSSTNVGMEIKNCKVMNSTITSAAELLENGSWDNGDKVGGIIGYMVAGDKVTDCTVENVTITAYRDLGGIAGFSAGTISGCTVNTVSLVQDNSHHYKDYLITTYGEIVGSGTNATLENNTSSGVTINSIAS